MWRWLTHNRHSVGRRHAAPRLFALLLALLALSAFAAACGGGDGDPTSSASRSPSPTATRRASGTPTHSVTPTPTAPGSPTPAPTPRNTQQPIFVTPTPAPTPTPSPNPQAKLYLALGDSLSYGSGASDRSVTAWVPIIARTLGSGWTLSNLGVPGDTSAELINRGRLDNAVSQIRERKNDAIPGNEVGAITLEIGGNDLLDLYEALVVPGTCPSVTESLQKPECVDGLRSALDNFTPNFRHIIVTLRSEAPNVPIFVMTLYNPFSGGNGNLDQIGALALEGQDGTPFPAGLNDEIRTVAESEGVHLVEWYPLFLGKQNQYISQDLIHPNDAGQQVMALAVLQAMGQAGLP